VALVIVIFTQFLSTGASPLQTAISVIVFVVLNAMVSQLMARRGRSWRYVFGEFVTMLVVNTIMGVILTWIEHALGLRPERVTLTLLFFLMFVITVLVVLFDRYHTVFRARGILEKRRKKGALKEAGATSSL